ncbi:MAG: DNA-binding protein [Bacteroidota bacterium]
MKRLLITLVLAALVGPLLTTAWAQQRSGKGMKKQMYEREYDMDAVETIEGEVIEITYNPGQRNAARMGVHMMVATDADTMSVHLGPVWFMEQQEEKIEKGDQVAITGSRITYDGSPALIAAEVKREQMTLRLRDRNGYPVWRGWRKSGNN